jgi:hypothetical protein
MKINIPDASKLLKHLRSQVADEKVRVTQHAQQEMAEENIALSEVFEALSNSRILEHYPNHRRGACCLLNGYTKNKRPLHIVCTTTRPTLIIITVYKPIPPKWIEPTQRRIKR